ncbi:MAG: hypothetical protein QXG05_01025 [Nitrososphaerota archaeon]
MSKYSIFDIKLISLSLFMAVSSVTLVYVAGLIDLLGSQTQTPYVVGGVLIGSILFSTIALIFSFKYSFALSLTLSAILSIILVYFSESDILFSNIQIMLLFACATSFNLPVAVLMSDIYYKVNQRNNVLYHIKAGLGSFIIFAMATTVYVLQGYSNLSSIVLSLQVLGFIALLSLMFLGKRSAEKE